MRFFCAHLKAVSAIASPKITVCLKIYFAVWKIYLLLRPNSNQKQKTMKKILFIAVLTAVSFAGFAQSEKTESKALKFSIGVEGALPIGDFGDVYSFGIGGSLQGEYKVAPELGLTLNAGYINYSVKDKFKGFGSESFGLIPVMAGIRYYFGEQKVYASAQLGAAFSTEKDGQTSFAYTPGIGYYFSPNFDAQLKYIGYSVKGGNSNTIGLRLAYNF